MLQLVFTDFVLGQESLFLILKLLHHFTKFIVLILNYSSIHFILHQPFCNIDNHLIIMHFHSISILYNQTFNISYANTIPKSEHPDATLLMSSTSNNLISFSTTYILPYFLIQFMKPFLGTNASSPLRLSSSSSCSSSDTLLLLLRLVPSSFHSSLTFASMCLALPVFLSNTTAS